ncbi:MAG: lipid-A-disaccharide synthase [Pseudomonadota bacterium]
MPANAPPRIALLAGEPSGDNLGGALMRALRQKAPGVVFVGIGGPAMQREGLESWIDMERLSVNGFVDPLLRLPDLLRILLSTRDRIIEAGVDCFIGVDFNFFNLLLERMLKQRGVRTVHYVSPTVWAWRRGRIRGIKKSTDLMLTLYPFETAIYEEHGIAVRFVGHPRADEIAPQQSGSDRATARHKLGLADDGPVVAVLPGSRGSEVKYTGEDFMRAMVLIARRLPAVRFVIPAANDRRRQQIEALVARFCSSLAVTIVNGQSTLAMQAADVVLVNSGTATLEAMLLKRPMVMSYRLGPMTYAVVSRLVQTRWFALPNILAGEALVPEFIQAAAQPENLASAVLEYLSHRDQAGLMARFDAIHRVLRRDAADQAALAVLGLTGHVASLS